MLQLIWLFAATQMRVIDYSTYGKTTVQSCQVLCCSAAQKPKNFGVSYQIRKATHELNVAYGEHPQLSL